MRIAKAVSRIANENGGNNDFVNTFALMSGVSAAKALEILTYGSGPVVIATNNQNLIGSKVSNKTLAGQYIKSMCFDGNDLNGICDFVFINDELLDNINNDSDKRPAILSNILAVVTLWHEGMHYADYLDASSQPPNSAGDDIGAQAEMSLFGFRPDYNNLDRYNKTKLPNANSPTPSKPNYFLGTNSAMGMFWGKYNYGGNFGKSYQLDLKTVTNAAKNVVKAVGKFISKIFRGGGSSTPKNGGSRPSY